MIPVAKVTISMLFCGAFAAAGISDALAKGGISRWTLASMAQQHADVEAANQPGAVCTSEELESLFTLARQQDRSGIDTMSTVDYLAYEGAGLRQYVKFTFGTAVFIQSTTRRNSRGFDEIDHWIIVAGLDGRLVSASHDQIIESNANVVRVKDLPNGDKEAIGVAREIIERFLRRLVAT